MSAPIWKTPKGDLGTIQEQEFYELNLKCIVPGDTSPDLSYKIIAGALPPGIVLNETTGTVYGRPKDIYKFRGVPFDVSEDVTSTFCCRATNLKTSKVSDRTWSLTVTGQDAPTLVSNTEELGVVFDGSYQEFQVTAIDLDNEALTYYISNGSLPQGLILNSKTGLISGIIQPSGFLEAGSLVGWSSEDPWDLKPWDYNSRTISKRFEFDISVTDGKDIVSKKHSIYVISKDSLTADNEDILVNGYYDLVTADKDNKRNPFLTTPSTDLGTYLHLNYFAYKFDAIDFDFDTVSYSLLIGENIGFDNEINGFDSVLLDIGDFELPPGLTLSEQTGWLYGPISDIRSTQKTYTFGVRVYKRNYPEYTSRIVNFTITIVGDLRYVIDWVTPADLGTIEAGEVSELAVEATNAFGKKLLYSLQIGSKSRLPQGLRLIDNGLIVGRASFEVTTFDKNTLIFDKNIRELGTSLPETTFDREYNFTVKANDIDGDIITYKSFKVKVTTVYNRPYESLYVRANPGLEDKEIYNQIVFNTDIIPNEFVYRNGDPYFGKQRSLDVLVISGINPSTASEYVEAMAVNHYRKKLLLGEPKLARALDNDGNVKYEVLYIDMKDDNGSADKIIDLRARINRFITTDYNSPSIDHTYVSVNDYGRTVYPNSLLAMRSQIREILGYVDREVLPKWMTSKQEDGNIPYWNPALVLAYLKPGTGRQVKFLLERFFKFDLKDISFDFDRYIWDCNLSSAYNSLTNNYIESNLTTFDLDIRQGSDTLVYNFPADGSTVEFDCTIQIEQGILDIVIEKYITIDDSTLVLDRSVQIEDTHYYRDGNLIVFYFAPPDNSTVVVNYTSNQIVQADFAVTFPFNKIDGMTSDYVDDVLGGLDSIIGVYPGKRIIFARQEQYPGYIEPNDGWVENIVKWDDNVAWDDPTIGFDEYRVVPGYDENQADPDIINERAGIWEIKLENGLLKLDFIQKVDLNQRVAVSNGTIYGGKIVRYGPNIKFDVGETVPSYRIIKDQLTGIETIFDGGSTRFVENISVYQAPDEGDKYLVFPRVNIFA
jgi:hypothetical protein